MQISMPTTSSWRLRATYSARSGCPSTCGRRTTAVSSESWFEKEQEDAVMKKVLAAILSMLFAAGNASAAESVIEHYGLEQATTPVSELPGWRKPKRILVGGFISGVAEHVQAAAPGVEVVVAKPGELAQQAAGADVVIGFCTPELIAAGKSIRWIQLVTAGVESCVGIPAVRERNILVTNMQRIGGPIIAEHAMGMVLT